MRNMSDNVTMLIQRAFRFGRVQYGPGTSLGPRDTIGYEFVRILKGKVQWTCDGTLYEAGPGSFILSQPNHIEHYRWDPNGLTQHDFIHFHLNSLPPELPPTAAWPRHAQVEAHDVLHALFQYIMELKQSGHPLMMLMIKQALQQMLYAWVLDIHEYTDRGFLDFPEPVQRVMDLVYSQWHEHIFRPPSLDTMAKQAKVSRSSFVRVFQSECGESPGRFFENQRLHLVQLYLLESNRSISQIANLLQYPNPFHLSRNFKQYFGLSPRTYRNKWPSVPGIHPSYVFQKVFNTLSATQTI